MAVTWWIPSHSHEYFVPFSFGFFFFLFRFFILIYIHHSSSLSTNQARPNSEQRDRLGAGFSLGWRWSIFIRRLRREPRSCNVVVAYVHPVR